MHSDDTFRPAAPSTSSAFVGTPDHVPGPRDLAALQRDTLAVMAKAPAVFVLLPALAFLPFDFLNELATGAIDSDDPATVLRALSTYTRVAQWIELGVGSLVAACVLRATLAVGRGETPTFNATLKDGIAGWGQAFKTTFISGLLAGLATLLFIVPGLVLATRYALAVPATVIDGLDSNEARKKSTALVQSRGTFRLFLWGAAAIFSWSMLTLVPSFVIGLVSPLLGNAVLIGLVSALTTSAWNIMSAGLVVAAGLLYLELTEGDADRAHLVWPAGRALRDAKGGRIAGPKSTGQVGLAIVAVVGGLAALTVLPLIVLSVWFLVDADSATAVIDSSPILTNIVNALWGAEPAVVDPSSLTPPS